jgi:KUP system potassium uptake protein
VQQAIQLGALPRLDLRQTSDEQIGQVYVPQINWLLAAAVIGLVLGFRSSDALANAYGIAVAGDMLVTTLLVAVVAFGVWGWPRLAVVIVAGFFLASTSPLFRPTFARYRPVVGFLLSLAG